MRGTSGSENAVNNAINTAKVKEQRRIDTAQPRAAAAAGRGRRKV